MPQLRVHVQAILDGVGTSGSTEQGFAAVRRGREGSWLRSLANARLRQQNAEPLVALKGLWSAGGTVSRRYMRSIATILACGSVWGCATTGGSSSSTCTSALNPSVRSLNEILDSARVQSQVSRLWPSDAGLVVARVGGATAPVSSPVRVWSASSSDALESELAAVLEAASRISLDTEETAYLFMGDASGPALRRLDRLGQCAPSIPNERSVARRIAEEARDLNLQQRAVVRLFVFVERDGSVREVRVEETSGDATVDVAAASVFRNVRFTPARIEGMPVAVWARFPVTFSPR